MYASRLNCSKKANGVHGRGCHQVQVGWCLLGKAANAGEGSSTWGGVNACTMMLTLYPYGSFIPSNLNNNKVPFLIPVCPTRFLYVNSQLLNSLPAPHTSWLAMSITKFAIYFYAKATIVYRWVDLPQHGGHPPGSRSRSLGFHRRLDANREQGGHGQEEEILSQTPIRWGQRHSQSVGLAQKS